MRPRRPRSTRVGSAPALVGAALLSILPARGAAAELSLHAAIAAARASHPGLQAGAAAAQAARDEATAAERGRLPTLTVGARAILSDEPMQGFGLKLDEQRITAGDFDPARLNRPDPVGGVGLGVTLTQPLYAGGRIDATRRAAAAQAEAEASRQLRRGDELALAVAEAYLGAEAAEAGVQYAEDGLRSARETERTVSARNAQGLALDADLARAAAYRAGAEADLAAARQRLASARSGLALLVGDAAQTATLTTALDGGAPPQAQEAPPPADRPDLRAARLQEDAARAAADAAGAALRPQLMAQVSVETLRSSLDQGATWFTGALVARWDLSLASAPAHAAAEARARAAERARRWEDAQAVRQVADAREAIAAADARVASAREAVAASETARALRLARHRQGLLPLTDVLDAEAGLAGARALLVRSLYDARVARAELALALGEPIEGADT